MADLDDFFAKKDKKKKKNKPRFSKANTDVIAQNLEEQRSKDQEKETAATIANSVSKDSTSIPGENNENDDEWYEYDPEEKDYSGLKIETLKIEEDSTKEDDGADKENEASDDTTKKDGPSVWSVRVSSNGNSDPVEEDEEVEEEPSAPKTATYVPPRRRPQGLLKRISKAAPDINSQIFFPSLSSSVQSGDDNSRRDEFEEVKSGGGSSSHHQKTEVPRLALDNKFSALRE